MEALGLISQLYMWILVVLLFLGIGIGILGFANFVTEKLQVKQAPSVKKSINKEFEQKPIVFKSNYMAKPIEVDSNWLPFAAFSFLGLLFIVTLLGLFSMNQKPAIANQHLQNQNTIYPNFGAQMNGMGYPSNMNNNSDPYGNMILNKNYTNEYFGSSQSKDVFVNHAHSNTFSPMGSLYQGSPMLPYQTNGQDFSLMNNMSYYQWGSGLYYP